MLTKRTNVRVAAFALVAALGVLAAPMARADIIEYSFSPDASLTEEGDNAYSVTGTFNYDTVAENIISADITLALTANPGGCAFGCISPQTFSALNPRGTYVSDNSIEVGVSSPLAAINYPSYIQINFQSLLALDESDLLDGSSTVYDPYLNFGAVGMFASGSADPVSTPAPASLALLGLGLIGIGALRQKAKAA